MNPKKKATSLRRPNVLLVQVLFTAWMAVILSVPAAANSADERPTEVDLELISTEIRTLPEPIRLGHDEQAPLRHQALIVTVEVEIEDLDALAPSLQPVLYVGDRLVPLYGARPGRSESTMQLEAYAFEWDGLEEEAPVVLTVDIGVTERQPERFSGSRQPRFSWRNVRDRR